VLRRRIDRALDRRTEFGAARPDFLLTFRNLPEPHRVMIRVKILAEKGFDDCHAVQKRLQSMLTQSRSGGPLGVYFPSDLSRFPREVLT
jgi:hypothetical protein